MLDKQSLVELADIYKEKYNRLIKDNAELERQIDEANAEIERLRKERDEARRMACEKEETLGCDERGVPRNGSARDHAKQRGWDCFKENIDD